MNEPNHAPRGPVVQDYMSCRPRVVDQNTSIIQAYSIMRDNGFHHLPVVEQGRLIGLLSDRDILNAWTTLPQEVPSVQQVMARTPYAVAHDAPLQGVLTQMMKRKLRCVVVHDRSDRVVGVFTFSDAMRALVSLLEAAREATDLPLVPGAPAPEVTPLRV